MGTVVRGRPVALVGFTQDMEPVVGGARVDVDTYQGAVRALASAPSDLPACVADLSGQVRGLLSAVQRADAVPGAFGRALQALDDDGASRAGSAEVSDPAALAAAFEAALADPQASVLDLREVGEGAGDARVVAWGRFVTEFVVGASATSTGVDAAGQVARWANRPIAWLDLVVTESNFDAHGSHRTPYWANALDASADAVDAAEEAVTFRPTFVDDALQSVPRVGQALKVANGVLGVGGVALGTWDGIQDLGDQHYVDGAVALAGAGASAALMTGWCLAPLGPVGLGAAATVAGASIIYENREAIARAAGATVDAVGDAASAVGRAAGGAASAVSDAVGHAADTVTRVAKGAWPW